MTTCYKIVSIKKGEIQTLFHGINGSKVLPRNEWIRGENRPNVRDGSGNRYYTSGIHVMTSLADAQQYLRRFRKDDRVIIRCIAQGLRKKEHSPSNVYLADKIYIPRKCVV